MNSLRRAQQRYHLRHKDKLNEKSRQYHLLYKDQINKRHAHYRLTLKGKIVELLKHCRARQICTVDINYILELWELQHGLCALSKQPMTYGGEIQPTTLSLDRLDPSKGYVKGNIRLLCWWVNCAKGNLDDKTFRDWCRTTIYRQKSTQKTNVAEMV